MITPIHRTDRIQEYQSFRQLIDTANSIIISSHQNPDADAIGSVIAMKEYLLSIGKKSSIVMCDKTPYNLTFLDYDNSIIHYDNNRDYALLESADLILILDVNTLSRLKKVGEDLAPLQKKIVLIDHHHDPKIVPELKIVDTNSPSTCELLYTLFSADSTFAPNKELTTALYAGIYMDTGGFRFHRTDSETLLISAELVQCGADPVAIYDEIINSAPIGRTQLVGRVFHSMKLHSNNKVCLVSISKKDFEETNTNVDHADGIVSTLLEIKGVELAVIMIEDKDRIKLSFRSKALFPANELAKVFNGGGHFNAAGGTLPVSLTLDEAAEEVIKALGEFSIYL